MPMRQTWIGLTAVTLFGVGLVSYVGAQVATTQPAEGDRPSQWWAVKAFTRDGHTMNVKAVTSGGEVLDVKAIPSHDLVLDVKAIGQNGELIPVKLLPWRTEGSYYPVAAILPNGETAELLAFPRDSENGYGVRGIDHRGVVVDIKAIAADSPPLAVKAISPHGTVFAVKGLIFDDGASEGEIDGVEYVGAVKALPNLHHDG